MVARVSSLIPGPKELFCECTMNQDVEKRRFALTSSKGYRSGLWLLSYGKQQMTACQSCFSQTQ